MSRPLVLALPVDSLALVPPAPALLMVRTRLLFVQLVRQWIRPGIYDISLPH